MATVVQGHMPMQLLWWCSPSAGRTSTPTRRSSRHSGSCTASPERSASNLRGWRAAGIFPGGGARPLLGVLSLRCNVAYLRRQMTGAWRPSIFSLHELLIVARDLHGWKLRFGFATRFGSCCIHEHRRSKMFVCMHCMRCIRCKACCCKDYTQTFDRVDPKGARTHVDGSSLRQYTGARSCPLRRGQQSGLLERTKQRLVLLATTP
jgi:hypothetical protein